jgi:D-alanyl-D-alanine carboxypeptidase
MKTKSILMLATLIIGTTVGPLAPWAQAQRARPAVRLDPVAQTALLEALAGPEGEYAARATYAAILAEFGPTVQPYANILRAEERHIAALQQQCVKYGIAVPADEYLGNIAAPETLFEAAEAGVAAEEANVAMYDAWLRLPEVARSPSLVQVFTNLRAASLLGHLPAFEAALLNDGTTPGCGAQNSRTTQGASDPIQQRRQDGTCLSE